jgi:hypothetical protein
LDQKILEAALKSLEAMVLPTEMGQVGDFEQKKTEINCRPKL